MVMAAERIIKDTAVKVFNEQTSAGISNKRLDVSRYNAVAVEVRIVGTSPSVDLYVEGSYSAGGFFIPVSDPEGTQLGLTSNQMFYISVGTLWVRVRLENVVVGADDEGITVIITPFVSPGLNKMTAI